MRSTFVPPTRLLAVLVVAFAVTRAAVAEYSWQIAGGRQTVEAGDQIDGDTSTIVATHFFKPVSEELGAAAVSAFLSRSSSISLGGYGDEQAQRRALRSVAQPPTFDTTADGTNLTGRYVWRESGWYTGGGVETAEVEQPSFTPPPDTDVRSYRVFGGKYLGAATSVDLSLRSSTTTTDYPDSPICSFLSCIARTEIGTDEVAVQALHVGDVGAVQYSVSGSISSRDGSFEFTDRPVVPRPPTFPPINFPPIGGGIVAVLISVPLGTQQDASSDEVDAYSVAGEILPTRRLGVRLGYTSWNGDVLREDGYEIAATWFFVRNVGVRFAFARATNDFVFESGLNTFDSSTVRLIGRF